MKGFHHDVKTRTALGAAIVSVCALVTACGIGVGVATVANAATPTTTPAQTAPHSAAQCPVGWSMYGPAGNGESAVCVNTQRASGADVNGCPAGWSLVPQPVEIDGVERSRCAQGGMAEVLRDGGGAGYSRGIYWTRWVGMVHIPAGRHVVTLVGGNAHSIAMIDRATLAPIGADDVQGVRSVILTGPETVKATLDWSGKKRPWLMVEPVLGASR